MSTSATETATSAPSAAARSLVSLLGESRAAIVHHLRGDGDASVAELARPPRHLRGRDAPPPRPARGRGARRRPHRQPGPGPPGRPLPADRRRPAAVPRRPTTSSRPRCSTSWPRPRAARASAPSCGGGSSAQVDEPRRRGHRRRPRPTASPSSPSALSAAGFAASVAADGAGFTLTQDHCAIEDVARDHPELCAYEAATFAAVLGNDVHAAPPRHRSTRGDGACVCCVTAKPATPSARPTTAPPRRPRRPATSGSAAAGRRMRTAPHPT